MKVKDYMDNIMNSARHYDEAEMVHFEEIVAIYDDLVLTNMNLISQSQKQIKKKNNEGALVIILFMIAFGLNLLRTVRTRSNSMSEFQPQKECHRQELMEYLVHTKQCHDIIRMRPEAFLQLCQRIRATVLVLHIIGPNVNNQSVSFFFHRYGETVSRHFHNVLSAILRLE